MSKMTAQFLPSLAFLILGVWLCAFNDARPVKAQLSMTGADGGGFGGGGVNQVLFDAVATGSDSGSCSFIWTSHLSRYANRYCRHRSQLRNDCGSYWSDL